MYISIMYVHVCMYVFMYVCVCVGMYVCKCMNVHVCMYACNESDPLFISD